MRSVPVSVSVDRSQRLGASHLEHAVVGGVDEMLPDRVLPARLGVLGLDVSQPTLERLGHTNSRARNAMGVRCTT